MSVTLNFINENKTRIKTNTGNLVLTLRELEELNPSICKFIRSSKTADCFELNISIEKIPDSNLYFFVRDLISEAKGIAIDNEKELLKKRIFELKEGLKHLLDCVDEYTDIGHDVSLQYLRKMIKE